MDERGQRQFLDFLLESGGVSAYFLRSGLGQMYTFDADDVEKMARVGQQHLEGRAPTLLGAAGIWDRNRRRYPDAKVYTEQAVGFSRLAQELGFDGVVHTVPEGLRPQAGETPHDVVLGYFESVSRAVEIPIVIYQPPGTDPAYVLTPEVALLLAAIPNVVGMKASTSDAAYICDICSATSDRDFVFITGAETAFYAGLCAGSPAVIGQGCCINPQILGAVQSRFDQGDLEGAIKAQASANLLVRACPDPQRFLKMYAAEKGYAVQPFGRSKGIKRRKGVHMLTKDAYNGFKRLLETELSRYT